MKALIVFGDEKTREVAAAVSKGAQKAGAETHLLSVSQHPRIESYDLILLGSQGVSAKALESLINRSHLMGKKTGVFCLHGGFFGKKVLEQLVSLLERKHAQVIGTTSLRTKGILAFIGKGELAEGELARAEAFGERAVHNAKGVRIVKESEKARIKGYRK